MTESTEERIEEPDIAWEIFTNLTRALALVSFPWWWLDYDAPITRRIWRWRYSYLLFGLGAAVVSFEAIQAGEYWLLSMAIAPHVIALALAGWIYVAGAIAGVGAPYVAVADLWLLGGLAGLGWGLVFVEILRRKAPWIPLLPAVPYHRESDDQYVLPMSLLRDRSEGANRVPRLTIGVSTLVLGETGAGKSTALQLLAYHLPYDDGTAVIVHDDNENAHREFYEDLGFETIRLSIEDADVVWNLFRDVEKELELIELSNVVFGKKDSGDPFHGMAKQVFRASLTYLYREADRQDAMDKVGHDDLIEFLNQPRETLKERLEEYDDLRGSAEHLSKETGRSAPNVYQGVHENVNEVFVGDFADDGDFSLREYIENPDGRVLIIDSSAAQTETVGPMFRLMIDWAIKYAMEADNDVNFLLDEVDQLPKLQQLQNLTARGRSSNTKALVGVQTIGQLEASYGRDVAGVTGNCPQGLYFSPGDKKTTEYILSELGKRREQVGSTTVRRSDDAFSTNKRSKTVSETDRYPITSSELKQFEPGDCVVKGRGNWWSGNIAQLSKIEPRLEPDPYRSESEQQADENSPALDPARDEIPSSDSDSLDVGTASPTEADPGTTADTATHRDGASGPNDAVVEDSSAASTSADGRTTSSESDTEGTSTESTADSGSSTDPERIKLVPETEPGVEPADWTELEQWHTWKPTDDKRKIPRAPYANESPDTWVDAGDPDVWTTHERASQAAQQHAGHRLAFTIRDRDAFPDEDCVLIDYDDVRDPDTGMIHPTVRDHLEQAGSYAEVSTSGTGIHILCRGGLPDGIKSVTAQLPQEPTFPDAAIEVYDSKRFIAITGEHLVNTPEHTVECQEFLFELAKEFATVSESTPDQAVDEPEKTAEEIHDIETTTEIQDLFDAIEYTRPQDIRLRSTVTEERSDGSKSLDPSWADSDSGTRLAQLDDGWVYREGMYALDALQVVALEEGIIRDPRAYPSDEDFWNAVQALRERGAHIPLYEPRESLEASH